jgi:hypothetical protein
MSPPLALDDDSSSSLSKEASPVNPSTNAALNDDQFFSEDSVTLLFQEQVLRVL